MGLFSMTMPITARYESWNPTSESIEGSITSKKKTEALITFSISGFRLIVLPIIIKPRQVAALKTAGEKPVTAAYDPTNNN